jgi:AraC family transcriptional regulator
MQPVNSSASQMGQLLNTKPIAPLFSRMIEGISTSVVPSTRPHLNHSSNTEFHRKMVQQGYGLKYVWSGKEQYRVNGQRHSVTEGQFLLVSHGSNCEVEIRNQQSVEGFCFYLPEQLVSQAWSGMQQTPEQLLEPADVEAPVFFESVSNARHSVLGQQLTQLALQVRSSEQAGEELNEEVFLHLIGTLCSQQLHSRQQQSLLPVRKKSTSEELYHRLLIARDFLHDRFSEQITLTEMAQAAMLSEFHFLRTFKTVFRESPYQYLLRLRMEMAQTLLQNGQSSLSEIAFNCGFREVQTFSKLFRKMQGISPTAYQQLHQK